MRSARLALAALMLWAGQAWPAPEGLATWAAHVSLVPAASTLTGAGLGLITDYFYSAPYEDVRLKAK